MTIMNKTLGALFCLVLATFISSCGENKPPRTSYKPAIVLDLKSGEGIRKSIVLTCNPQNWTQARFDSINTAINTLASAGRLNRNINEDKKHLANLFTSSAVCLEQKVDSIFKLSVYKEYPQMKKDLVYLKKYLPIYIKAAVRIDSVNPSIAKIEELFFEYEKRLRLSRNTFQQKAQFLVPYSQNYTQIENIIKENNKPKEYWSKYFCHNKEIVEGVNAFPSRLSKSRKDYYANLEELVEKIAIDENYSKEKLESVEDDFYRMAKDYNQNAISKLRMFREGYTPKSDDTTKL